MDSEQQIPQTLQNPEARLWEHTRRTGGPTSYFIVIVDGDKNICFELTHDPKENSFKADAYLPQDYDYTVHDGCDHENQDCILDTEEYQQKEWEDTKLFSAINALRMERNQLQQTKLANQIAEKKRLEDDPGLIKEREDEEKEHAWTQEQADIDEREHQRNTITPRVVQAITWNCIHCNAHCSIEKNLLTIPFVFVCPDSDCAARYLVDPKTNSVKEEVSGVQENKEV